MKKPLDNAYWEKKRRFIRFSPELNVTADIDLREYGKDFSADLKALVFSESQGGCGLVVLANDLLEHGMTIRVKIGDLNPIAAQIVWRKDIDSQVILLGLKYLE